MEIFGSCFVMFLTCMVFSANVEGRFGLYRRVTSFDGLSLEFRYVSKVQCAARCLATNCRGIQYDVGHCKILYETSDVPQSERTKYNQTSLVSSGKIKILVNALHECSSNDSCRHGGVCEVVDEIYQCNCTGTEHYGSLCETALPKCSSLRPCRHAGVCEAVDGFYQCNCTGTDHYEPMCETAGNPWAAPDGWVGLHPHLNLNMDDQIPYIMHNGTTHVTTENGFGFKRDGGSQYVDLGNWTGDTCFVDVNKCEQGFTMLADVNFVTGPTSRAHGYIGSAAFAQNGMSLSGTSTYSIISELRVNGRKFDARSPASGFTYPTGWIRLMVVYTTGVSVQVYINNTVVAEDYGSQPTSDSTMTNGHIVIGRQLTAAPIDLLYYYGKLIVDHLTIWDRPLNEEERNLVHQN